MKNKFKFLNKVLENKVIKKMNSYNFMPVIWWTLLVVVLAYGSSLLKVKVVWRVGLVFLILNNICAYQIGKVINERKLKAWWLVLLPIVFVLVVLSHYAKYNLILIVTYFVFEMFGLMNKDFYRK
ncbi:hypothetical protein [Lactobacillus psittaci]|uniref:hypothetical protein n=1 Tax=Lactobacillus psittaci TaxID=116089 RepID=UPI000555828F|nr:hypothetical protein [Lactobacillus psittaci]